MSPSLHHRLSLGLALLAGLWFAVEQPEQRLFEQTMRELDLSGQILGILDPLAAIVAAFLAMLAVYALAYVLLGVARHALSTLRGAPSP